MPRLVHPVAIMIAASLAARTPLAIAQESVPAPSAAAVSIGGRTLVHSTIIHMPADQLFALFTTGDGIVSAWSVAKAKVDFRIGGQIRTAYEAATDLESSGAIVNTILAYEPGRMLAIKATAPEGSPEWLQLACRDTHSVLTLDPIAPDTTRLTITGIGYGEGELWDQAYAFFDKGNAWTLDQMKQKLGDGGVDSAKTAETMDLLRSFVGDWTFEQTGPTGATFRGLTRFYALVDGAWIGADGWLGDDDGMQPHAHWVSGVNPETGLIGYSNWFEHGHLGTGHISLAAPNTLGFEMIVHAADRREGQKPPLPRTMYVEFERTGEDAFTSRFFDGVDRRTDGIKPMMELAYTRVVSIPERFLKMKGQTATRASEPAIAPIVIRATVPAALADVWHAWTTTDGLSATLGRTTRVDLRVGGPFEILWSDDAPEGERGSEGCTVLSYVPERMLAFSWNAPPRFAHARQHHTHVVLEFRAVNADSTEVTLTHLGFDTLAAQFPAHEAEYREIRAYFAQAWPYVLAHFVEHFEKK